MMVIKLEQSQCWRRSDPRASRSRRRTKRDIRRSKEKEKVGAAHSHKAVPYLLLLAADASRDTIAPEGARTGPDPAEGWSEGEEEQRIEPRRPRYRALAGWYNEDDRAGSWRWPRLTATMTHPQRGYACNTRDTQGPRRWSGGGDAVSNRPRGQAVRGRPSERKPGRSRSTAALPRKNRDLLVWSLDTFSGRQWPARLGDGLVQRPGWREKPRGFVIFSGSTIGQPSGSRVRNVNVNERVDQSRRRFGAVHRLGEAGFRMDERGRHEAPAAFRNDRRALATYLARPWLARKTLALL